MLALSGEGVRGGRRQRDRVEPVVGVRRVPQRDGIVGTDGRCREGRHLDDIERDDPVAGRDESAYPRRSEATRWIGEQQVREDEVRREVERIADHCGVWVLKPANPAQRPEESREDEQPADQVSWLPRPHEQAGRDRARTDSHVEHVRLTGLDAVEPPAEIADHDDSRTQRPEREPSPPLPGRHLFSLEKDLSVIVRWRAASGRRPRRAPSSAGNR